MQQNGAKRSVMNGTITFFINLYQNDCSFWNGYFSVIPIHKIDGICSNEVIMQEII